MTQKLYRSPRTQTCQTEEALFEALIQLYARAVLREVVQGLIWTTIMKGFPFPPKA